jgi:uncharacterized protein with PIN domain
MSQANFRFIAELNDFLAEERRQVDFSYSFEGTPSVKHLVEALGVPHTEVARILVNGEPQGFGYQVQDLDRVEVVPASAVPSAPLRAGSDRQVQEPLAGELRFILDNHLGRLAIYLRMLSFDALYRAIIRTMAGPGCRTEKRILLTQDIRLLMRSAVVYGYWVRSKTPRACRSCPPLQPETAFIPFRRCLRCNTLLQPVEKEAILHRLEPLTRLYYDEFHLCPACDQIYWRGSHYARMQQLVERVRDPDLIDR